MKCEKRPGVECETPIVCGRSLLTRVCLYNDDPVHPNRVEIPAALAETPKMRRYAIQRKVPTDADAPAKPWVWETVLNFDAQPCAKENLAAWLNTGMKADWKVVGPDSETTKPAETKPAKSLLHEAADALEGMANWHLASTPKDLQDLIDRLRQ